MIENRKNIVIMTSFYGTMQNDGLTKQYSEREKQ